MQKLSFMNGIVLMMTGTGPTSVTINHNLYYNASIILKKLSECSHSVHFVVTDKNDNLVKGIFSVNNIDCDNGVFELADVNWTPQMKRTRVSTESIYLVLSLFFNKLGYRRCEWRTNIYN